MDVALEQLIRYELREASNQGLSGFVYDIVVIFVSI